ncbi:MAG: hypothetical protein HW421_1468 [Ignavibacteria bacterium]|nr:hypothetical protein [Ignavibacteria bacterium]
MNTKYISSEHIISTILVFIVLMIFPIFFQLDFLDPIQNTFQDLQITDIVFSRFRSPKKETVDNNIVLVNIGITRTEIAQQIETINKYQPKVVGIDALFLKPKDNETDSILEAAFAQTKNLVFVSKLVNYDNDAKNYQSCVTSIDRFNRYGSHGFANLIFDEKGNQTVREFKPVQKVEGTSIKEISVQIAEKFDQAATISFLARKKENEKINYRRNIEKYITLDIEDVLNENSKLEVIRNKIVLLGYLGANIKTKSSEDNFFTSMNRKYIGKTMPDMYGVVIHANKISMILAYDYLSTTPYWFSILLAIAIVYLNMVLFSYFRRMSDRLYESVNFVAVFIELVLFLFGILSVFHLWGYEIEIAGGFFSIIFCPIAFELYHDTLNPIGKSILVKLKARNDNTEQKSNSSDNSNYSQ